MTNNPFATSNGVTQKNPDPLGPSYKHYPIPRVFGKESATAGVFIGGETFGDMAYNAPLFANLISWALYRSEFFGINPR